MIMELWDIYDTDRIPTGATAVRGEKLEKGAYHMVIHVCIFNSEGKMLIQQRQPWKTYGDKWDVTVGGAAVKGDTSRDAAHRELFEELGLDMDFSAMRPGLTMNFLTGFDDFYLINREVDISELRLQPEEVKAVRWAELEEIEKLIDSGDFVPYFKSFIAMLFDIRNKPDCLNI